MMKAKKLKKKLRGREVVTAAWTLLGNSAIAEIFAASGVDFIGIDLEHSTTTLEQADRMIAASHAGGAFCLPRLASHQPETIKRLLDAGADGIIAPMVSTVEQVEALVSALKYPPIGTRGYGINRAQAYGPGFSDYIREWNDSGSFIVQIETAEGMKNLDAILAHPEVDAAMIGTYDLSAALGVPGEPEHPRVQEACVRFLAACKAHGKGSGTLMMNTDQASIQKKIAEGYTFLILSSDMFLLAKWAEETRRAIGSVG